MQTWQEINPDLLERKKFSTAVHLIHSPHIIFSKQALQFKYCEPKCRSETSQRLKCLHPPILCGPHKSHYIDVDFSHSKSHIYYNFCVLESTANNFQKLLWSYSITDQVTYHLKCFPFLYLLLKAWSIFDISFSKKTWCNAGSFHL